MQSNSNEKKRSLLKALKKENQKPNPDRETLLMLDIELKKIEPNYELNLIKK
jgi:hypothetical protein